MLFKSSSEPLKQRLARTLEHNCVEDDETDDEHLSPRSTMRAALALDPTLVQALSGNETRAPGRQSFLNEMFSPRRSMTLTLLPSFHRDFQ